MTEAQTKLQEKKKQLNIEIKCIKCKRKLILKTVGEPVLSIQMKFMYTFEFYHDSFVSNSLVLYSMCKPKTGDII